MSSSLGLRNWRGQIVEPLANFAAADVADAPQAAVHANVDRDALSPRKSAKRKETREKKHKKKSSRRHAEADTASDADADGGDVVYVKDEFGRDVPVERARKKHEKKRKKHHKRSRSRSMDDRRLQGTPPPADPIRPQLDEERGSRHSQSRHRRRSPSRSRNRERSHRRSRGLSRSRSPSPSRRFGRPQRRSRSRSRSRPRDTGQAAWTHDGFENRSPSPVREVVPGYMPEPEQYSGELESECGSEISLLLPRIVVWMDKTKQQHHRGTDVASPLETQLACVHLFLTSTNSHKYMREFTQADGVRVLLQILETDAPPHHHGVSVSHRCMVYSVLSRIVQSGREFKEQISRLGGELSMVRGAVATVDRSMKPIVNLQSRLWTLCRMTLLEQFVGNRACVEASYSAVLFMLHHELEVVRLFGAQILRELISESSFFFDNHFRRANLRALMPLSVELLHSTSIPLLHEGLELVHSLLQKPSTRRPICSLLAKWIHDAAIVADPVDPEYAAMKRTREYEMYIHMRSPFVHAAQSLTTLMHSIPRILPLLVQTHEVLIPLAFVLAVERPQSLKWLAALTTLHFVFERCRDVAASHLSELFMVSMDDLLVLPHHISPEALAEELLRDEAHQREVGLHFFQNGWVRALPPPAVNSHGGGLRHDDGNVDPSLDALEYDVEAAVHRVIPAVAPHTPYEGEENDDADSAGDALDFAAENQLIEKLERHFMKFRRFSAIPSATK